MKEKVMKNQEGVTLFALIITVIIIMVLASVTTYMGIESLDKLRLQTISTNMLMIQIKCKSYAEKAAFSNDTSELKGTLLSTVLEDSSSEEYLEVNKLIENGTISTDDEYYDKLYLITPEDLVEMGLEIETNGAYYIVNYHTEEVYYTQGYEINDITYYKLSELQVTVDI